jgi:membrane fusion protein (multidrug efflux system)
MTEGRRWMAVAAVAGAAALVVLLAKLRPTGAAEEGESTPTDVTVHVGRITRATLHRYVAAYGRVEAAPAEGGVPPASVALGSPVSGTLAEIDCAEGGTVAKGATLFRLDTRVSVVALEKARRTLEYAQAVYDRQAQLLSADGTSSRAVLDAKQQRDAAQSEVSAAEADIALRTLVAPITGTVVRIQSRLGQAIDTGTVIAEIVDLRRLVVAADVPSHEASLLRSGQEVQLPTGEAVGRLSYVGRAVDAASDTVRVRAPWAPKAGPARPGQLVEVRIVAAEHADRLVVPEASFVAREGEGAWIVRIEGERAVRQAVTAGFREGGWVEVEGEGLAEGQPIVANAYGLPAETKVHVAPR